MIAYLIKIKTMFRFILPTVFLFAFSIECVQAQDFQQRAKFTGINLGLNGLASGIGAVINRGESERSGPVFWKGFKRGLVGGALIDIGMRTTKLINTEQQIAWAWPARILSSAGNNIVYNASMNQGWFDELSFSLYTFRFDYHTKNRKFRIRLNTMGLASLWLASNKGRLRFDRTIQSGVMTFESSNLVGIGNIQASGLAYPLAIALDKEVTGYSISNTFAHEMVHILQFDRKSWVRAYVHKTDRKLQERSKLYKSLSSYIHFDLSAPAVLLTYIITSPQEWTCRVFEQEADAYSRGFHRGCSR